MVLRNADPKHITKAITENYYISWKSICRVFGYPDPKELFGVDGFISGIPYMMMNSLFDGYSGMTIEEAGKILNYFKENNLPLMWFISPTGINQGIDRLLDELGVELATMKVPGMAINLKSINENTLAEKRKHEISSLTEDKLDLYTNIFMKAFEINPSISSEMQKFSNTFLKHPNSSHYLGFVDDTPVACASVVYDAGVAGIYNVATIDEYRGRGLATSLMASCLLDALEKNFEYSILHSSSKGKSIYENLGYESYFIFKRYLLRPTDVGL